MVDFITPESILDLVPILISEENINKINEKIKEMVKNNYSEIVVHKLSNSEKLELFEVKKELCKRGWRVSGKLIDSQPDIVYIVVENPYHKCLPKDDEKVISFKGREI